MSLAVTDIICCLLDVSLGTCVIISRNLVSLILGSNIGRKFVYRVLHTGNVSIAVGEFIVRELFLNIVKSGLQTFHIIDSCSVCSLLVILLRNLIVYQSGNLTFCILNGSDALDSLFCGSASLIVLSVLILCRGDDAILLIEVLDDILLPILIVVRRQSVESICQFLVIDCLSLSVSVNHTLVCSLVVCQCLFQSGDCLFAFQYLIDRTCGSLDFALDGSLVIHDVLLCQVISLDFLEDGSDIEVIQSFCNLRTGVWIFSIIGNFQLRVKQSLQHVIFSRERFLCRVRFLRSDGGTLSICYAHVEVIDLVCGNLKNCIVFINSIEFLCDSTQLDEILFRHVSATVHRGGGCIESLADFVDDGLLLVDGILLFILCHGSLCLDSTTDSC